MNSLKMPDITPAQKAAAAKLLVVIASMVGLKINGTVSAQLVDVVIGAATVFCSAWVVVDGIIRGNRAKMKAAGGAPDALVADR